MPKQTTIEWQPINTAPKDGTPVLLYSPDASEPNIFVAQFVEAAGSGIPGEWQDWWRKDGCWPVDAEATHWMPLPEPPTI